MQDIFDRPPLEGYVTTEALTAWRQLGPFDLQSAMKEHKLIFTYDVPITEVYSKDGSRASAGQRCKVHDAIVFRRLITKKLIYEGQFKSVLESDRRVSYVKDGFGREILASGIHYIGLFKNNQRLGQSVKQTSAYGRGRLGSDSPYFNSSD